MANALNENLEGRYVVLVEKALAPAYRDIQNRIYKVEGGFGAMSFTAGTAIFGQTPVDGEKFRIEGSEIERFATDEEVFNVTGKDVEETHACRHCGHGIGKNPEGVWVAPDAGFDVEFGDGMWRDICPDNEDHPNPPHEPEEN